MSRGSHTRGKLRCYTRVGSDCLGSMPMTRQKPGARDQLTMHTACCGLVAMLPILAGSLACNRAPLPLVEAPGARAVFSGADAQGALAWATRLGMVAPPGASLFAQDAPWAASLLAGGELVLVLGIDAGLAAGLVGEPVLGEVRAVPAAEGKTLVRPDRGRVLLAPAVPEDRQAELAALLEVMATAKEPTVVTPPPPGTLRARFADELLPLGTVDLRLSFSADRQLVVEAKAPAARADLVAALTAPAPAWACALDEGALAVMAVPPVQAAGVDDAFSGPMLLALYPRGDEPEKEGDPLPGASLIVAGVPKDATGLDALGRLLPGEARIQTEGSRRTLEAEGVRTLRLVADEGLLAMGYGAAAPVSRIHPQTRCPAEPRPLMAGDLAAVGRALHGVLPVELGLVGPSPFVAWVRKEGSGLALEVRARVPPAVPF